MPRNAGKKKPALRHTNLVAMAKSASLTSVLKLPLVVVAQMQWNNELLEEGRSLLLLLLRCPSFPVTQHRLRNMCVT
jgi:hypothetical protein